MARVLFINVGSEGHINPTLGVVHELIRRGEEVVISPGTRCVIESNQLGQK